MASEEAGAPKVHKDLVLSAGYDDVTRTIIYSGRPMHVRKTPYVASWFVAAENNAITFRAHAPSRDGREQEVATLTSQGKIPHQVDLEDHPEKSMESRMCMSFPSFGGVGVFVDVITGLMGKVAGSIKVSSSVSAPLQPY